MIRHYPRRWRYRACLPPPSFLLLQHLVRTLTIHKMEEACCTCAALLSSITPQYDEKTEKPKAVDRRLHCCGRVVCAKCIHVGSMSSNFGLLIIDLSPRKMRDSLNTVPIVRFRRRLHLCHKASVTHQLTPRPHLQ